MAQSPRNQRYQPQRRSPPQEPPELRDPNEGTPPALAEGTEVAVIDPQEAAASLYPQFIPPPCYTIADEQRDRSAEIEEMGVINWIDAHDSRTEEEKADSQLQVAGVPNAKVIAKGGGDFSRRNEYAE